MYQFGCTKSLCGSNMDFADGKDIDEEVLLDAGWVAFTFKPEKNGETFELWFCSIECLERYLKNKEYVQP